MHAPDLMILGSDHIATHTVYMGPDGIKSSLFYDTKFGAPLCVCVWSLPPEMRTAWVWGSFFRH